MDKLFEIFSVYEFLHIPTGKRYVGSTEHICSRFAAHFRGKSRAKYFNSFMKNHSIQNEWFVGIIAEFSSRKEALHFEGLRTKFLEKLGFRLGYELLNLVHGGFGRKRKFNWSEEQKQRNSLNVKEMWKNPILREKRIESIKAVNIPLMSSVEMREKISLRTKEAMARPEVLEKLRNIDKTYMLLRWARFRIAKGKPRIGDKELVENYENKQKT